MKKLLALLAASVAVLPNAALAEPAPAPPPYEGAYQPQGVDEIGMWREDDESERRLAASPLVIQDEALNSYIKSILCAAVGEDRCNATRIYIMREPTFNATMSPNGTMRVFSGLLLRMRSEAELAAILGHEFGHFENRHSLNRFQSRRNGTDILAWAGLLVGVSSNRDVRRSYRDVQLSVYGNLYSYKRNQEREADLLGLGYLNASDYPPIAASDVWQNLMGELDASAVTRGLKKPRYNAVAFTASHPPHGERAAYLNALAMPDQLGRDDGSSRYHKALEDWMPLFLEDQIKLNDFGASEYIIGNLAEASGWTADLWFARGELYRTRGNQRDFVNAVEFYENAIALEDTLAEAHRGLGLSLFKIARPSDGQVSLRRYLELNPDASDAAMIRMMAPGVPTE